MSVQHEGFTIIPASPSSLGRRPRSTTDDSSGNSENNRRKASKVTRACDWCRSKKMRCSGTNPCDTCLKRAVSCHWEGTYTRGRATEPAANDQMKAEIQPRYERFDSQSRQVVTQQYSGNGSSRATPEVEIAGPNGQYHDRTSGLAFVHRAFRRILRRDEEHLPASDTGPNTDQTILCSGDQPMQVAFNISSTAVYDIKDLHTLLTVYFDTCSVTYRFFHRPSMFAWLRDTIPAFTNGVSPTSLIGHAKAASLFTAFAIASFRKAQIRNATTEPLESLLSSGDGYFELSKRFTAEETGHAGLDSVQARLLQVLYLLQTRRMSQAWYLFGVVVQMISALGLHRSSTRTRALVNDTIDCITLQCQRRTFWAAYTMDTYLCIVLGRPKHYNDDDIDQKFPDPVIDEALTASGHFGDIDEDSPVDGLIWHAKLAQIISATSREVYTVRRTTTVSRLSAICRLGAELKHWRNNLPPHLGKIKASSLVPTLKRQSIALRLAYCHAQMHTHRAILVESHGPAADSRQIQDSVDECSKGAETAMETVEAMVKDGALFYSLWWSQYVLFCALSVAFVFAIQLKRGILVDQDQRAQSLLSLANRCKTRLWDNNFANTRYTVILEELMEEAQQVPFGASNGGRSDTRELLTMLPAGTTAHHVGDLQQDTSYAEADVLGQNAYQDLFEDFDPSDWLDLDASAYNTLFESISPVKL